MSANSAKVHTMTFFSVSSAVGAELAVTTRARTKLWIPSYVYGRRRSGGVLDDSADEAEVASRR